MDNLFLSPREISRAISDIGEKKATESLSELLIFGILAGIYIAFGAAVAIAVLSGGTLDPGVAKFWKTQKTQDALDNNVPVKKL